MADSPFLNPEALTSDERWRRWEQRGRTNDARFMRRARQMFWSGAVVVAGALLLSLLT